MQAQRRRQLIGVIVLLMITNAVIVLSSAGSLDGTEIARFRNAFLAEAAEESVFQWTPASMPEDYLQETAPAPAELRNWVQPLAQYGDVAAKALAIARALSVHPRYGEPIQSTTMTTLSKIVTQGTGYCVDYTKVFTALAHASGLTARQWAFSFDGFGGHGHMFSEVWDAAASQWIMVDVFHGFIPRDASTAAPLSALEFRRRLTSDSATIRWDRITPYHFAFKNDLEALDYYRRGQWEWYLWWGNNVVAYDNDPLIAQAAHLGRLPEQVGAMLTGALPKFKVILNQQNRLAFERLMWLKYWLIGAAVFEVLLVISLFWHLWQGSRQRQNLAVSRAAAFSAHE